MRHCKRLILTFGTAVALLLATPAALASNPSYEQGLEAVREYRYSVALMHFSLAAEQGHKDAQRILGMMLVYGERLYGRDVPRDRERGKRWLRAAAAQGCEVSSLMLKALAQHTG